MAVKEVTRFQTHRTLLLNQQSLLPLTHGASFRHVGVLSSADSLAGCWLVHDLKASRDTRPVWTGLRFQLRVECEVTRLIHTVPQCKRSDLKAARETASTMLMKDSNLLAIFTRDEVTQTCHTTSQNFSESSRYRPYSSVFYRHTGSLFHYSPCRGGVCRAPRLPFS